MSFLMTDVHAIEDGPVPAMPDSPLPFTLNKLSGDSEDEGAQRGSAFACGVYQGANGPKSNAVTGTFPLAVGWDSDSVQADGYRVFRADDGQRLNGADLPGSEGSFQWEGDNPDTGVFYE